MPSKKEGYRSISFPSKMVSDIEELIKKHPNWGYGSVAEFMKEAVRKHKHHMLTLESWDALELESKTRPNQ